MSILISAKAEKRLPVHFLLWIAEGRVTVNGAIVRLGSQADAAHDSIKVDGKRIKLPTSPRYFAFHKPPGIVTTLNDPQRRPDLTRFLAHMGDKQTLTLTIK